MVSLKWQEHASKFLRLVVVGLFQMSVSYFLHIPELIASGIPLSYLLNLPELAQKMCTKHFWNLLCLLRPLLVTSIDSKDYSLRDTVAVPPDLPTKPSPSQRKT